MLHDCCLILIMYRTHSPLTGNELFAAHNQYNLAAIVAESTSEDIGSASYYGVAITKRGMCATVDGSSTGGSITGFDSSLEVRSSSA